MQCKTYLHNHVRQILHVCSFPSRLFLSLPFGSALRPPVCLAKLMRSGMPFVTALASAPFILGIASCLCARAAPVNSFQQELRCSFLPLSVPGKAACPAGN